jgi:4'-phosphopantetheinyl transferase
MTDPAATNSAGRLPKEPHLYVPGEVKLWLRSVEAGTGTNERMRLLDEREQARAAQFRFERDRVRFVARRAFVRSILARYLGVDPQEVRIRTSTMGRPGLAEDSDVSFNTSHSDGVVAVAVARGCRVGVDIERVRSVGDALAIAEGLFTQREIESLLSVPEPSRSKAFLTLWTRKESLVKAIGDGLSLPLNSFEMPLHENGQVRWVRDRQQQPPCAFVDLRQLEGYVGAVTLVGTTVRPRLSVIAVA